jgi:uncharacterized protein with HEPN domain
MKSNIGDKTRLQHIFDAVTEVEKYIKGISFEKFIESSLHKAAVIKQLEVIGEAANHISNKTKRGNRNVDWTRITGLRNILVHEYFGIDYIVIWNIIKTIARFKERN